MTMLERIKTLAENRGLSLRRTGNLYQLRGMLGTVYQTHSQDELYIWLRRNVMFFAMNSECLGKNYAVSDRAVKYGRLRRRP